jgi:KUP system potassium uptake protein
MTATASTRQASAEAAAEPMTPHGSGFWILTLGTLGVVYGDIGTSPLYALKESLSAAAAGGPVTSRGM